MDLMVVSGLACPRCSWTNFTLNPPLASELPVRSHDLLSSYGGVFASLCHDLLSLGIGFAIPDREPMIGELVHQSRDDNGDHNYDYQDHQEAAHRQKGYKCAPEAFRFFRCFCVPGLIQVLNDGPL